MAKKLDELRLRGFPVELKSDLVNIAKNSGVTLSSLLKTKLRDLRDSYPDHMRRQTGN